MQYLQPGDVRKDHHERQDGNGFDFAPAVTEMLIHSLKFPGAVYTYPVRIDFTQLRSVALCGPPQPPLPLPLSHSGSLI